jgi:NADH-ubiquinone oxidoreductase chain 2
MGIPPLIGFFGKQMILSAALDKGLIFLSLIAILTSVIGAIYYLNIVKEIFFYSPEYVINPLFETIKISAKKTTLSLSTTLTKTKLDVINIKHNNIVISSSMALIISIITLIILLFMLFNKE